MAMRHTTVRRRRRRMNIMRFVRILLLLLKVILLLDHHHVQESVALSTKSITKINQKQIHVVTPKEEVATSSSSRSRSSDSRRDFVKELFVTSSSVAAVSVSASTIFLLPEQAHATRAVGIAEIECRAAGNCLEKLEIDGALGWNWGAKDRCDASDPNCGFDGKARESPLVGDPVPDPLGCVITHIVELSFSIGRNTDEDCTIKIGLYGTQLPDTVLTQFLQFMSPTTANGGGIQTMSDLVFENGMGVDAIPVSFRNGGILHQIVPGERVDFGIPLQSNAYARNKGLSKAGDSFVPQPRPSELKWATDVPVLRKHDVSGLLSIPEKGIGYGGSGFESDDECFASSFQLTAKSGGGPIPTMDKDNRRVIGQVIDEKSMKSLARLVSLPINKGFRGIIPGQNSGPPLQKVVVTNVKVLENNSDVKDVNVNVKSDAAEPVSSDESS